MENECKKNHPKLQLIIRWLNKILTHFFVFSLLYTDFIWTTESKIASQKHEKMTKKNGAATFVRPTFVRPDICPTTMSRHPKNRRRRKLAKSVLKRSTPSRLIDFPEFCFCNFLDTHTKKILIFLTQTQDCCKYIKIYWPGCFSTNKNIYLLRF